MGKARQQPGSCLAADVLRADVTSENGAAVHQVSGLGLRVSRTHSHLRKRLISHVKEGSVGTSPADGETLCSTTLPAPGGRDRGASFPSQSLPDRPPLRSPMRAPGASARAPAAATTSARHLRARRSGVLAPRDPSFAQGALV